MKTFTLVSLLLLTSSTTFAQGMATAFESEEVAPGLHVIYGAEGKFGGGNVGLLVGDDQIVLIDDSFDSLAAALVDTIKEIAGRPADFVINTHYHGDHTGGNGALAEDGTIVVAHDNIRKRLVEDASRSGGAAGIPVVTFSESITFHVNGREAHVFHLENAHTDGDGAIHFRDINVIHTGDLLFNGIFPYIDLDGGGSLDGYIDGQRRILALSDEDTVIIPGHGSTVASRADLQRSIDMLVDGKSRVQALVDKGMDQEQVLAENPLAEYHDDWNWGFITTERMTQTFYRALTAE